MNSDLGWNFLGLRRDSYAKDQQEHYRHCPHYLPIGEMKLSS
jgi:hypothetical protein